MMDLFERDAAPIAVSRRANEGTVAMKGFHYHDSYEIYYLVKGKRNYVIDDEFFSLSKGDIALIKPGILHKTAGGAYDRILINFTKPYLNTFFTPEARLILLSCFDDKIITVPSDQRLKVRELMEKIASLLEDGYEKLTFIYLTELLNTLMLTKKQSVLSESKVPPDGKTITKILHYINKHYSEIENIQQIAEKFFITKYHLCRTFKGATNISVIEYLNRVKIKKACTLLENTEKNITEICTDCGFNSSVYFCKLFKKLMNMTPSQYRERIEDFNHEAGGIVTGTHAATPLTYINK